MDKSEAELLCLFSDYTSKPVFEVFLKSCSTKTFLNKIRHAVISANTSSINNAVLNLNWNCPGQEFWRTEYAHTCKKGNALSAKALTQLHVWSALAHD